MKRPSLILVAAAAVALSTLPAAADDPKPGGAAKPADKGGDAAKPDEKAAPQPAAVGKSAPDFALTDSDGKEVKLSSFKGKIVVLQWFNPGCPVDRRVNKAGLIAKMLDQLKDASSDFVFLPIDSTAGLDGKKDAAYLVEHKIKQKPLLDPEGTVGHSYGAQTTPHMFVIDAKGVLRYGGALDDDPAGKNADGAKNYVVDAVKQIVAGKEIAQPTTQPYG